MEKTKKSKNLFLKFLPKASSVVSFQNHPFSPGRDHHHKHKAQAHKGFSGPINFSALPDEARSKPKNGSYHAQEPTSPKVSCMGQIKHKHKKKKLIKAAKKAGNKSQPFISSDDDKQRKKSNSTTTIGRFFTRSSNKDHHQSSVHDSKGRPAVPDHGDDKNKVIPSLGQMRRFASGRESLANFDWTAQIAPIDHDHDHDRDCYSDDERKRSDSDDDDDDDEVIIPHSAPILMVGGLEPRKEINIWKRRTMAPPPPLSLNSKVR